MDLPKRWPGWLFLLGEALAFGVVTWAVGSFLVSEANFPEVLHWLLVVLASVGGPVWTLIDLERRGPERRRAKFFRGAPPWAEPLWDEKLRPFLVGVWLGSLTWIVSFALWATSGLLFRLAWDLADLAFVLGILLGLAVSVLVFRRGHRPLAIGAALGSFILNGLFLVP